MNPFLEDYQPLPVRQLEESPADLNGVIIRIEDIEKRVQQCENCLKNISEQLNKMSKDSAARNELKERALTVLEKKKILEMNREILKFQPIMDQMGLQRAKNVSATNNVSGFEEMKIGDVKTENSGDKSESFGKPELEALSSVKDEGPRSVRDVVLNFFYNKSIAMMKFIFNLIFTIIFTIIKFLFNQVIAVIKFWIQCILCFVLVNIVATLVFCLFGIGFNFNTINIHDTILESSSIDIGTGHRAGLHFSNNLWKFEWPTSSYKLDLMVRVTILVFRELLARDPFFEAVSNVYNFILHNVSTISG